MITTILGCRFRAVYALILMTLFMAGFKAHAAVADSVAGTTVQASQPSPAIIGPGDSYNVIFQSWLVPKESGVENLAETGQTWVITSVAYSSDDVNWTTIWSGSASTAAVAGYGVIFGISGGTGVAELTGETTANSAGSTAVGAAAAAAHALASGVGSTVVATPDGFYLVNVTTSVNYTAIVNGAEHQGQATGNGSTTEPVAEITGLAVGSPATQTNMIQDYPNQGDINYGVVKKSDDQPTANAQATATTSPNTVAVENQIKWSNGTAVSGNNAERNYSLASSQKYTIDPTLGGHGWKGHNVYLWVIWATVTINLNGNISPNDKAVVLSINGGKWPDYLGGGTGLGPINCIANKNLTYAYAVGKYEAKGQIQPSGVWNVVKGNAWYLDRIVQDVAWDNAGDYVDAPSRTPYASTPCSDDPYGTKDTSDPSFEYDSPKDANGGTLYDLDAPACSIDLSGTGIYHNSEVYDDFSEFAVVTLDKLYRCSDFNDFYYEAQVNADVQKVDLNSLGNGAVTLPTKPHYSEVKPP